MTTLLVAEHDNKTVKDLTSKGLTAAKALGVWDAARACRRQGLQGCGRCAAQALTGWKKVLVADAAPLNINLPSPWRRSSCCSPAATTRIEFRPRQRPGKTSCRGSPRARRHADFRRHQSRVGDTFERPIYAGNAIQTVKSSDRKRSSRCARLQTLPGVGCRRIRKRRSRDRGGYSTFVGEQLSKSDRPELTSAKIIISGGRAMQSRKTSPNI